MKFIQISCFFLLAALAVACGQQNESDQQSSTDTKKMDDEWASSSEGSMIENIDDGLQVGFSLSDEMLASPGVEPDRLDDAAPDTKVEGDPSEGDATIRFRCLNPRKSLSGWYMIFVLKRHDGDQIRLRRKFRGLCTGFAVYMSGLKRGIYSAHMRIFNTNRKVVMAGSSGKFKFRGPDYKTRVKMKLRRIYPHAGTVVIEPIAVAPDRPKKSLDESGSEPVSKPEEVPSISGADDRDEPAIQPERPKNSVN